MQRYQRKHKVPFSAEQMFELVLDIESYPQFIPFCESLTIISRKQKDTGEEITADMYVGYKNFAEKYRSFITTDPDNRFIVVTCSDGPMKALENSWEFSDLEEGGGCEIDLVLSYKFRNPLLQMAMNALLDRASDKFLNAFEERARQKYG